MKPGEIFSKTLPFVWAKLLLGLATVLGSIVIFAILMGIAWLLKNDGVFMVMFFIWLAGTATINFLLNHYIGYLVKAGHIAVITEAVTTGIIPKNQVEYGKQMVKERFLTSNIYFVVDKLVSRAVSQIQRGVERVGGMMSVIPGMNAAVNIGKMFIAIALGYIDECCLGYTFFRREQGAFKSAADGVVIYWQNWKKLLKDAAKTTVMVIVLVVVVTLAAFLLFAGLFRLLGWNGFVAFILAVLVAWAVKKAFVDSYILVNMMASYMEVAPETKITFDLYEKLCGISAKFKELFNKGQQETPALAAAGTGTKKKA
ncbi:MAG: hypothetical protein LBU82_04380 [Treponema sp.]|jgi:hypothetical protein|nr:hypothetical protein [Treponema sp.]